MFGKREFLEDSDSSFEMEDPGTPPPYYQQAQPQFQPAQLDRDFEYEDKTKQSSYQQPDQSHFYTNPSKPAHYNPPQSDFATGGFVIDGMGPAKQGFQPVRKENSEKIGFYEESNASETSTRPETSSARPGSSNAQMRAKMLEAQRTKLLSRGGTGTNQVQSSNMFMAGVSSIVGQGLEQNTGISSLIYSNQIFNERDINGNKDLRGFSANNAFKYEPGPLKARQNEYIPAPIKPERTVFKGNDELEEVKLDEGSKHTPSKTLQGIHKQLEESKNPVAIYEAPVEVQYAQPKEMTEPRYVSEAKFTPPEPKYNPTETKNPSTEAKYMEPTKNPEPEVTKLPSTEPPADQFLPVAPESRSQMQNEPTHPIRSDSMDNRKSSIPRQPTINVREVLAQEMTDMKKFLTTPLPRGIMLQCNIRREKAGFGRLYPKYYLHISDGMTFLLAGKKRGGNRTSNYMITSNQKDFSVKSPAYLGKVRSNFLGTEFHAYDTGLNPKHKGANAMNAREELAVTLYVFFT